MTNIYKLFYETTELYTQHMQMWGEADITTDVTPTSAVCLHALL
jgi:hypothetical protein